MIKVGFDYDEPIFAWYDNAHDVSVKAGLTSPEAPPPTVWDPHSHYGCTIEEWFEVLNLEVLKGRDGMYGRPVKHSVVDAMRRMYTTGRYEIHLVTARGAFGDYGERIKRLTTEQVIREQVPHDSLHFTENKKDIIARLGLDYFIDDRDKYYLEAEAAGAEAYLLDERWNKDFEVPPERRVFSTVEYINKIMNRHGADRPALTAKQRDSLMTYPSAAKFGPADTITSSP